MNRTPLIRRWATLVFTMFLTAAPLAQADDHARELAASVNQAWDQAFNRADAQALASLYAEDATVSPGNGTVLNGREQIAGLFQGFFDNGLHSHRIEIVEVNLQGNTLYQVARWQANGAEQDGQTPVYGGILVSILHADADGNWKAHVHTWNMGQ